LVHRPPALRPSHALPLLAVLGVVQVGWLAWFLLEPLPNAGNAGGRGLCRLNLLVRAVPEVAIPGLRFRESYLGLALGELSHVENLPQRLPIVLAAAFIAASALATGGLVLRLLKLRGWLGPAERVALGFGLGTTGLGLATLIAGRWGLLDPRAVRAALAVPIVVEVGWTLATRRATVGVREGERPDRWSALGFAAVAGPFLIVMALGAMLPTIDFDAIEYHLQGPKEYYQAGRIAFLPHNVYTSMPFSIEMLHLLGMEVAGDWWLGALVGQLLVATFAPASAALIVLATRRLASPRAAWVAGIVYLTTPWVYRLAVLPYVEGPLCYFHAAMVWAAVRAGLGQPNDGPRPAALGGLVGLLAGGAMAIKYPALVSAVVPFGAWAVARSWRTRDWRLAGGFAVGVGVVIAPWLARNVVDTGNPVYPLAYRVFGGRHWDPASDAKWSAAHGPRAITAAAFLRSVADVAGRSDWQSPLYAALGPLAFLRPGTRRASRWIAAFAAYLFLTWWFLTHRLDRFWLPMLPPLAVLAGLGADWTRGRAWTVLLAGVMAVAVATDAVYSSTALAGLNEWTGDLRALRRGVPRLLNRPLADLDDRLPPGARPLLVGQAAVFHLDRPIVYNTVFDLETIETIARDHTPAEVRAELARLGVTHVYVDWFEIERYRSPGNYGFTPFVTPGLFDRLVEGGVLAPPSRIGARQDLYEVRRP